MRDSCSSTEKATSSAPSHSPVLAPVRGLVLLPSIEITAHVPHMSESHGSGKGISIKQINKTNH